MTTTYVLALCLLGLIVYYVCATGTLREKTVRPAFATFWVALLVWLLLSYGHLALSFAR